MARGSIAQRLDEPQAGEKARSPRFADRGPSPPGSSGEPVVSNARLAFIMFLGAEAMFFAGLIGAFLVFRLGSPIWPPPFQPRLPVAVTGINTMILLASGFSMWLALRSMRVGKNESLIEYLRMTALLGGVFLVIQGYEWARLIRFGLTVSSGVYGATFYTLIGCHALHVFGALIWLIVVWQLARRGRFTAQNDTGVRLCGMYWSFVVGLWPVLYGLVYLY